MSTVHELTALVLAGGRSLRYGSDKTQALILGRPMIEHVVQGLRDAGFFVVISAQGMSPFSALGCPVILDEVPFAGPLAALMGFFRSRATHSVNLLSNPSIKVLVAAADAPFVSRAVLHFLVQQSKGHDVTVLTDADGRVHPLPGIYSRTLLAVEGTLKDQHRADLKALQREEFSVNRIPWDAWRHLPGATESLININTPEDDYIPNNRGVSL